VTGEAPPAPGLTRRPAKQPDHQEQQVISHVEDTTAAHNMLEFKPVCTRLNAACLRCGMMHGGCIQSGAKLWPSCCWRLFHIILSERYERIPKNYKSQAARVQLPLTRAMSPIEYRRLLQLLVGRGCPSPPPLFTKFAPPRSVSPILSVYLVLSEQINAFKAMLVLHSCQSSYT